MNTSFLIMGGVILVAVFLLTCLVLKPLRALFALVLNTLVGWAGLYIFNLLLASSGLVIGINIVSATTVGVLGLPGLVLLIVLKFLYL
jgi:inhibitor of the pro-sigma K processing machinery